MDLKIDEIPLRGMEVVPSFYLRRSHAVHNSLGPFAAAIKHYISLHSLQGNLPFHIPLLQGTMHALAQRCRPRSGP